MRGPLLACCLMIVSCAHSEVLDRPADRSLAPCSTCDAAQAFDLGVRNLRALGPAAQGLSLDDPACRQAVRTGATDALRVLHEPETVLGPELLQGNRHQDLIRRANEDLAATRLMRLHQASDGRCMTLGRWAVTSAVRRDNAEYLLSRLSTRYVLDIQAEGGAVGAMDVILRHYDRQDRLGQRLEERALSIYASLLERDAIDPVSYGGLVDRYRIRRELPQVYGTHIACLDGAMRYDPPLENPEELDQRRRTIGWPSVQDPVGRSCPSR